MLSRGRGGSSAQGEVREGRIAGSAAAREGGGRIARQLFALACVNDDAQGRRLDVREG